MEETTIFFKIYKSVFSFVNCQFTANGSDLYGFSKHQCLHQKFCFNELLMTTIILNTERFCFLIIVFLPYVFWYMQGFFYDRHLLCFSVE